MQGIRTEVLAELVDTDEALQDIADTYGLKLSVLKAALSYEFSPVVAA